MNCSFLLGDLNFNTINCGLEGLEGKSCLYTGFVASRKKMFYFFNVMRLLYKTHIQICRALVVSWTGCQYLLLQTLLLVPQETSRLPAYKKKKVHNLQTLPLGYSKECALFLQNLHLVQTPSTTVFSNVIHMDPLWRLKWNCTPRKCKITLESSMPACTLASRQNTFRSSAEAAAQLA